MTRIGRNSRTPQKTRNSSITISQPDPVLAVSNTQLSQMADEKPKRSLFKRPTWAANTTVAAASTSPDTATTTTTSKLDPPTDIFSRSHNYTEFLEDRQRQRREKTEKDVLRRQGTAKEEAAQPAKRRRISQKEDEDDEEEDATTSTTIKQHTPRKHSIESSPDHTIQSTATATPSKPRPRQQTVIELLDDSDDDVEQGNSFNRLPPPHEPTPAAEPEPDPDADLDALYDSDPEMREYVRKAREKRRQQEREREQSDAAHDPTVKLLITSPIPGTTPLIVTRKLSQNLQAVREAWVGKQSVDSETASRIFFTYKLRRVYDVTTVRSLGIKVDSWGRIMSSNNGPFANADDEHAEKIHIEAVTDETWQELKNKKAAPKANKYLSHTAAAQNTARNSAQGTPAVDADTHAEEPLIKITLKAKGYSDIKIKVRPVSLYNTFMSFPPLFFPSFFPVLTSL
jgi:hypothetical protein